MDERSLIFILGIGSHSTVVQGVVSLLYPGEQVFFCGFKENGEFFRSEEIKKEKVREKYRIPSEEDAKRALWISGMGDNYVRKQGVRALEKRFGKIQWINVVHPSAVVASDAKLGVGNFVGPQAVVNNGTVVGDHNIINTSASLDHDNVVRDFCHVAPHSALCGTVYLGEGVFVGTNSTLVPNTRCRPWSFIKAHSLVKDAKSSLIPIYQPNMKWVGESLIDAYRSSWISSLGGEYLVKAKAKMSEVFGVPYVVLVNNGTSATHCLFMALKEFHPEVKKIYVPNSVYVAVWNCVLYEYPMEAMEVCPVDVESLNIPTEDLSWLDKLEKGAALMIVHNTGNVIPIKRLYERRPDLILIEDNCEGFLGKYHGRYTGVDPKLLGSSVSFFGNKSITTGEGGAFLTCHKEIYDFISRKISQGNTSQRYIHDMLAYNQRMVNTAAAMLWDQLNVVDEIRTRKREIISKYQELLKPIKGVSVPKVDPDTELACWMSVVRVHNNPGFSEVAKFMTSHDVEIRPMFYPITTHEHLKNIAPIDPQATLINKEYFILPSYPQITDREIEYTVDKVREWVERISG